MNEDRFALSMTIVISMALLTTISLICVSYYMNDKMSYENFQKTITNLSDEQKCLHICGFNYPRNTYLDQYKLCIEKCDRISERGASLQR